MLTLNKACLIGGKRMKKYSKYMVLVLILSLILLTACSRNKSKEETTPSPTIEEQTKEPSNTIMPTEQEPEETPEPTETVLDATEEPEETPELTGPVKNLPIYTIQDETFDTEAYVARIPEDSEVTAELVVNTVVDSLKEHGLNVGIDSISQEGEAVIVSFEPDKAPLTDVGAGVEATILDCISQSLLDNVSDCKKVIFRSGGNAYESGHMVFEIDEPYNW